MEQLCHDEPEHLHALFSCHHSQGTGLALLGYAQKNVPNLCPEAAARIYFGGVRLSEKEELATICMLATGWLYIWETRVNKKQVCLYRMRAEVEAMVTILRKSRYQQGVGDMMLEMIN